MFFLAAALVWASVLVFVGYELTIGVRKVTLRTRGGAALGALILVIATCTMGANGSLWCLPLGFLAAAFVSNISYAMVEQAWKISANSFAVFCIGLVSWALYGLGNQNSSVPMNGFLRTLSPPLIIVLAILAFVLTTKNRQQRRGSMPWLALGLALAPFVLMIFFDDAFYHFFVPWPQTTK